MRARKVLERGGLIAFGLVLTLILIETVLQIGSLFVAEKTDLALSEWNTRDRRILALGDSNTYGVWLDEREREAYPAQLEKIWNDGDRPPVEVLNLGYPGTNSSQLLSLYRDFLEALDPDVVLVMVGVNDFWTEAIPLDDSTKGGGLLNYIKRNSRMYKGYNILRRRSDAAELKIEDTGIAEQGFEKGGAVISFGEHRFELSWKHKKHVRVQKAKADLRKNLRTLSRLSESYAVKLVLMTYPGRWGHYGFANQAIRAVANENGVPLIDLERVFRPLCPQRICTEWLYTDQHPKSVGYELVAETITDQLQEQIR